ncbi:hypothetical protein DIPPA_22715 [Diplonema papillatum]|nr:hypothetical protein DIPPA_22715 [Diplonema papillatum]
MGGGPGEAPREGAEKADWRGQSEDSGTRHAEEAVGDSLFPGVRQNQHSAARHAEEVVSGEPGSLFSGVRPSRCAEEAASVEPDSLFAGVRQGPNSGDPAQSSLRACSAPLGQRPMAGGGSPPLLVRGPALFVVEADGSGEGASASGDTDGRGVESGTNTDASQTAVLVPVERADDDEEDDGIRSDATPTDGGPQGKLAAGGAQVAATPEQGSPLGVSAVPGLYHQPPATPAAGGDQPPMHPRLQQQQLSAIDGPVSPAAAAAAAVFVAEAVAGAREGGACVPLPAGDSSNSRIDNINNSGTNNGSSNTGGWAAASKGEGSGSNNEGRGAVIDSGSAGHNGNINQDCSSRSNIIAADNETGNNNNIIANTSGDVGAGTSSPGPGSPRGSFANSSGKQQPALVAANGRTTVLDTWTYDGCADLLQTSDKVTIHVRDDVNGVSRNFVCRRDVLLQEMQYFKAYLSADCSIEDIEISVHCDASIFEWLMQYVHNKDSDDRPRSTPSVAVSILISSEFLQMKSLVAESLEYVVQHLQEIIKLPIDLDCINKTLLCRIASMLSVEALEKLRDRKDKIVGSLYLLKIDSLLKATDPAGKSTNVLYRCVHCRRLFAESQKAWSVCTKSQPFITYHGKSVSFHVPDTRWDVSAYLAAQRMKRLSWKDVYYRLWALITDDACKTCGHRFTVSELAHCSYHQALPRFGADSSVGVYPCCGAEVQRFEGGAARPPGGCCSRYHVLSDEGRRESIMAVVSKHADVLAPWEGGGGHPAPADAGAANSLYADPVDVSDDSDGRSSKSSSDCDAFGPDWRRRSRWALAATKPASFSEGDIVRRSLQGTCLHPPPASQVAPLQAASQGGPSAGPGVPLGSLAPGNPAGGRGKSVAGGSSYSVGTRKRRKKRATPAFASNNASISSANSGGNGGGGAAPGAGCKASNAPQQLQQQHSSSFNGLLPLTGPSLDWWQRLGPKGRTAYWADIQREDDARRMKDLVQCLEKQRVDLDPHPAAGHPLAQPPPPPPQGAARQGPEGAKPTAPASHGASFCKPDGGNAPRPAPGRKGSSCARKPGPPFQEASDRRHSAYR